MEVFLARKVIELGDFPAMLDECCNQLASRVSWGSSMMGPEIDAKLAIPEPCNRGLKLGGSISIDGNLDNLYDCIWVCLKIGYIPNYSHLIGIMISKTIGFFWVHNIFRHTHIIAISAESSVINTLETSWQQETFSTQNMPGGELPGVRRPCLSSPGHPTSQVFRGDLGGV